MHLLGERGRLGLPIATEKKTTNYRLTAVQASFSQTMVFERPNPFRAKHQYLLSSGFSITNLEWIFSI
jgi:hypothetical protein